MANIAPANFAYVNANGDKGDVQVLSAADITLLNEGLQDIEDLKLAIQKPLPAGTMIHYAGNVVPAGFLVCNGAAVSRTDYANLFTAIGTLYGAGDGSTTFNLPDARDRVLQGASSTYAVGTYIPAGLPNIEGSTGGFMRANELGDIGALSKTSILSDYGVGNQSSYYGSVVLNATNSNAYYGATSKPQVDGVSVYTLIKV